MKITHVFKITPQFWIFLSLFLCIFLLTSCGFELRGNMELPPKMQKLYLESVQIYGPFERSLRAELSSSNVEIVKEPTKATAIIQILNSNLSQTSSNISVSNQTREYLLTLTVSFQVLEPNGHIVLTPRTVTSTRQFTASVNQMLASNAQSQTLANDMYNEAAFFAMNILTSQQTREALKGTGPASAKS